MRVNKTNCTVVTSTSNERIERISSDLDCSVVDYIFVHQVYDEFYKNKCFSDMLNISKLKYLRLDYPGLSKSRNVGLLNVETKYAYIMDDDVLFESDKIKKLVDWMESNRVDIATCQFRFESGSYPKNYNSKPFKHNMLSAAKVSSVEICVSVGRLREKGIRFDERFGLGTDLPSGEEYIFITDCLKAGLNVWFYPVTIGVHPDITSGIDFYTNCRKILAKREMFKRIFGWKSSMFIYAFWLKKLPKVIKTGYFWSFSKTMLLGLK